MSDRVLRMNEASAADWDHVPFPAKQQLGEHGRLVDARSGGGLVAELGAPDDVQPEGLVREVTYHMHESRTDVGGTGSNDVHDQSAGTTQREVPGRNVRSYEAAAQSSSGESASGAEGNASTSGGENDSGGTGVPGGSIQDVLAWVGDDKSRARSAMEAENRKSQPRQSLLSQLNDRV